MNITPSPASAFPYEGASRPLVRAIMDSEIVGIALVRGVAHLHVMANAKYATLVGERAGVIGRPLREVIRAVPEIVLKGVLEGGGGASVRDVLTTQPNAPARYATFTFHGVSGDPAAILVIAEDVTERVRERDRAALFRALVGELLPSMNPREAVRSVVEQTARALGAKMSSLFLVGRDGTTLQGAPGEWDWTRTSFDVPLHEWPTIEAAITSGQAKYLTAAKARGAEAGWFEAQGTVGALCVPLRTNDKAIGVLFFDFESAQPPPIATVDFTEHVASHCAAVLARALAVS
jgi:hypothetical protein